MPAGTTKASVKSVFSARLRDLIEKARSASEGAKFSGQRRWCIPDTLAAADLFSIEQLHQPAWDRTEINTNYEQCFQSVTDPGTTGDVIGLKLKVDYNAMEERAFRFRHASVCRCIVHAMSRRHAEAEGPTFPFVEETVSDVISAGGA